MKVLVDLVYATFIGLFIWVIETVFPSDSGDMSHHHLTVYCIVIALWAGIGHNAGRRFEKTNP